MIQKLVDHSKDNPKKWWTILKGIVGFNNEDEIPPLNNNGDIIYEWESKCKLFNDYFSNICNMEVPNPCNLDLNEVISHPDFDLSELDLTKQDIKDQLLILNSKKAYGWDKISPVFLKVDSTKIVNCLYNIFEFSLENGIFPESWKKAVVLPLYKKETPTLVSNYRPVSILCTMSKVFEKIVYKYVFNHLRDNFILLPNQHGFLPGHSTTTQLLEMLHFINENYSHGINTSCLFRYQ